MALPRKFFEPSFRHRRLGAFLSIIVGIMVFMAAFVMAAEASLSAITLAWNQNLGARLTVEIPAVDDEAAITQSDRVKQALAILHAMPTIASATAVPDSDAARLLQPWISDPELLKVLPIPSLIDVERKAGASLSAEDIRQQLKVTIRDIRVDDHAEWRDNLQRFVHGIAIFGGLMILLASLTLALAVGLVCRAIMATERETVSLLHMMGAEDNDIAQHFEDHARRISITPALAGFLAALLSAGVLLFFLRNFADPTLLQQAHWLILAALVLAVPVTAVWISSLSARLSVLAFLRSMP